MIFHRASIRQRDATTSHHVDFLRVRRETLWSAIANDVSVLRADTADTGEENLRLDGHHRVCLERNVILRSDHRKFIEFQSHAVGNELHLVLSSAHELRSIGTLTDTLENAAVDIAWDCARAKLLLDPRVEVEYVGVRVAQLLR